MRIVLTFHATEDGIILNFPPTCIAFPFFPLGAHVNVYQSKKMLMTVELYVCRQRAAFRMQAKFALSTLVPYAFIDIETTGNAIAKFLQIRRFLV